MARRYDAAVEVAKTLALAAAEAEADELASAGPSAAARGALALAARRAASAAAVVGGVARGPNGAKVSAGSAARGPMAIVRPLLSEAFSDDTIAGFGDVSWGGKRALTLRCAALGSLAV